MGQSNLLVRGLVASSIGSSDFGQFANRIAVGLFIQAPAVGETSSISAPSAFVVKALASGICGDVCTRCCDSSAVSVPAPYLYQSCYIAIEWNGLCVVDDLGEGNALLEHDRDDGTTLRGKYPHQYGFNQHGIDNVFRPLAR